MSEMVERVARILEPQAWQALGMGDTLAYKNRRTSSLRKARAALEALRTPTPYMRARGTGQLADSVINGMPGAFDRIWAEAIEAALSDDGRGG